MVFIEERFLRVACLKTHDPRLDFSVFLLQSASCTIDPVSDCDREINLQHAIRDVNDIVSNLFPFREL